jgi:alpha-1,3-rhamnosyl/mannosyltransferase
VSAPVPSPAAPTPLRHLAVEATRLAREARGIGRYVRALLPRLVALRPALHLTLYVKPRDVAATTAACTADAALGGRVAVRPVGELRGARADAFWFPWNIARPAPRRGVVVTTVMDIVPVALPDPRLRSWRRNRRWRRLYAATAERSTLLVVPSAFTGDELARTFGTPGERMRVTPLAADDGLAPPAVPTDETLARLGVRRPFVLAVGASEPRKNLAVLDAAMPHVVAAVPEATLVLAGPRATPATVPEPPWKHTTGYVSDVDLTALYRAASCLVMPSTYEGFGLPVLEAMQHGTPVVSVPCASLPEVGGDAAAWVPPDDPAQMAAAIVRVLTDQEARVAMRTAGIARAARFTWDATARLTLAAFDEAVALGEPSPERRGWRAWTGRSPRGR